MAAQCRWAPAGQGNHCKCDRGAPAECRIEERAAAAAEAGEEEEQLSLRRLGRRLVTVHEELGMYQQLIDKFRRGRICLPTGLPGSSTREGSCAALHCAGWPHLAQWGCTHQPDGVFLPGQVLSTCLRMWCASSSALPN